MLSACGVINPVGDGAYNPSYEQPDNESHFVHCLGDGCGYYPIGYGYGGCALDSKVRPGQVLLWKYQGDGAHRPSNIAYRLPPSVVRAAFYGAEAVGDTFTDCRPHARRDFYEG